MHRFHLSKIKVLSFIRLILASHICSTDSIPWVHTWGKKGPLTMTENLSTCKSTWSLIRIYIVNTPARPHHPRGGAVLEGSSRVEGPRGWKAECWPTGEGYVARRGGRVASPRADRASPGREPTPARAGVRPDFPKKTKCISYVYQDQVYTHMIDVMSEISINSNKNVQEVKPLHYLFITLRR
jgi:hypothetical protein